jgi:hypothetical protein
MRTPEFLSPSSISTWLEDRDEFYLRYLTEDRPPRPHQTQPMAVGSAFDAYVKSDLYARFVAGGDPAYEFEALFEAQVEGQNRDWARENGLHVYESYKAVGAYDALARQIERSETPPRFEFEVKGEVEHDGRAVTLLGKPDLVFTLEGQIIIRDWKVNGYCGRSPKSPEPGYVTIYGGRSHGKPHPMATLKDVRGVTVNAGKGLEAVNLSWARQLSVYAWLLGAEVGGDFVCGIEQIVSKPVAGGKPEIRVAAHTYQVGKLFQIALYATAATIMDAIANDHIFTDVSFEEDKRRRKALDQMASAFDASNPMDALFLQMAR